MKKYIVKNCPAFCDYTRQCRGAYDRKISHQYCSGNNDTDCLLKRIVELCEENYGNENYELANAILNLLEIEEVE